VNTPKRFFTGEAFQCFDARHGTERKALCTPNQREAEKKAREWVAEVDQRKAEPRENVALSAAIESYLAHCTASHLAVTTVKGYRLKLKQFLTFTGDVNLADWDNEATIAQVGAFLDHRREVAQVEDIKGERVVLSGFFNYLRAKRWHRGENPADAKLHNLKRPRKRLRPKRGTTEAEDLILRIEGQKTPLWPLILLAQWAGMRRGEICTLRWSEIDLVKGYADVVGHELGRKHPRRVWLVPWVVVQLRAIRPPWLPDGQDWPVWPFHPATASDMWAAFCDAHIHREIGFNGLRASWATESYASGMTAEEEAQIGGHIPEVARKHYVEWSAEKARFKLPGDPLFKGRNKRPEPTPDARSDAASG
jgi:integrase